jgi:purine-binding chemotaxis protein CheW
MVDLAKIRKKAKKKDAELAANAAAAHSEGSSLALTPAAAPIESIPVEASSPVTVGLTAPQASANKLEAFKEQAGKRRAAETAKLELEDHARLELLTFIISGEHYAVDIERIVEIVTPRAVTRIPNADPSIVGIISLRGTIVTLVDVRRKLRHPEAPEVNADTRVVVIDFHNEMIGFIVDRVLRVVKTEAGEIEAHPVVHATELDESIRGVFRANGALTILLDLDKLLDHTWT